MTHTLRGALSELTYQAIRLTNGRAAGVRILTYHRVTDAHPGDRLCVPVARFSEQMRWLHEAGYQTISFAQTVAWVTGGTRDVQPGTRSPKPGTTPTAKSVVLTFDDGYEDNFLHAYPAMARYGLTGIFFVPSAFIEGGPDGHVSAVDRPMSWVQLQELVQTGHEIGAHSVSHAKLTQLPPERVTWEISGCKQALEQHLQHAVDFFCYPSGDYDDHVRETVVACGYRGACTVEPGANHPGDDPFVLTRTEISAYDSLRDFEKKLAGAYDWMHGVWQWSQR